MTKLVVLVHFEAFPRFGTTNGGWAQCLCLRPWAGLNAYARGDGWGLMSMPEAMGGV